MSLPSRRRLFKDLVLYYPRAITQEQANILALDFDAKLKRKKYEGNHFDSVIRDFRETEISLPRWSPASQAILRSLFDLSFSHEPTTKQQQRELLPPHVLELKPETGEILPHVDSVKHGGGVVAVLSLLSSRRLVLTEPQGDYAAAAVAEAEGKGEKEKAPGEVIGEMEVEPLSLYVLHGESRYNMAHAINKGPLRRVSIVFRDAPPEGGYNSMY